MSSERAVLYARASGDQYDDLKKPLDGALEHHTGEVPTLSRELEQTAKLDDHMQSITKFAEVAAARLDTEYAAKIENGVKLSVD